jgi:hypothetical protein
MRRVSGQPFLQQLDALADQLDGEIAHAGEIAARPRPALRKLSGDRIAAEAEHHRLRRLRLKHRERHEFLRDDHFGISRERRARHRTHIVESARPEDAQLEVAAFNPAELAQANAQRFKIRRWLVRPPYAKPCNTSNAARLLCARSQRPGGDHATDERDEITTPHGWPPGSEYAILLL